MSLRLLAMANRSANGVYTMQWLGEPTVQAIGPTAAVARRRLIKAITNEQASLNLANFDDWVDAKIFSKVFTVQPIHQHNKQRRLVGTPIAVPIRYVRIEFNTGRRSCYLPELNLWTEWSTEGDNPPPELDLAVKYRSASVTTEKLLRWWPPLHSELEWIPIRYNNKWNCSSCRSTKFFEDLAEPLQHKVSVFLPAEIREQRPVEELKKFITAGGGIVVGEAGCGKSTLIEAACVELEGQARAERKRLPKIERKVPEPRFWRTSAHRLISGMRYLGQWQERVETAVQVLNDVQGFLILENLRDMVRLGDSSPRDSMAAFLVPFIRTGQVRMIVESTPSELDAIQQLVPGIVEALPIFKVQPWTPSSEELLLHRLLDHRLSDRKIYVEPEIPRTIQRLCSQFQSASAPPSATVRFAEKMVDRLIKRGKKDALCVNEVVTQFSELYGVPEVLLRDELPLDKSSIVESLKSEVIGQQRPCEVAANVFSRIKSNLNDPGRPFANLFFCGPTGVGKTQLAKAIAKALFGYQKHKTPLVRVDMSEYSSPGSSALFLQDNTGNPATWLLNIRNRPLSVLLLDEVEKASPDVFDVLLSLLDEGRLTDRYGQTTSFRSCVIIMTSNIGVRRGGSLGFNEESSVDFRAEIRRAFRPEFFNRLDEIVAFNPLGFDAIAAIAAKELRDLSDREGIHQRNIQLEWTQQVLERLARVGFHPELGARPLQKAVESNIVGPLSRWLVKHKAVSNCRLLLDFDGDSLIIQQPS
ncbi:MAG: AAA family ATPase [Planctomycetota bacterium]